MLSESRKTYPPFSNVDSEVMYSCFKRSFSNFILLIEKISDLVNPLVFITVDFGSKEPGYIFSFCYRILQSQTFLAYRIYFCLVNVSLFNDEIFLSKRSVVPAFF